MVSSAISIWLTQAPSRRDGRSAAPWVARCIVLRDIPANRPGGRLRRGEGRGSARSPSRRVERGDRDMLSRRIERPIEEEREVFGDEAEVFLFLVFRRPPEVLQGNGEQAVEGPRMNDEARRQRKAELRRHDREHRALNVTVAVEEWMNLAEPAEGVGESEQLVVVLLTGLVEQRMDVDPQFLHTPGHFAGRAEFVDHLGIDLAPGGHPYVGE